ncbi:hypothetical protein TWF481_002606 [Arthrobotrys musiformis]|uniref:DNA 3'-5' helicase n=1 Tax=Arthrobotrys musiformis TaxID=47236 RepID=A0AAV9VRW5_9PEZI
MAIAKETVLNGLPRLTVRDWHQLSVAIVNRVFKPRAADEGWDTQLDRELDVTGGGSAGAAEMEDDDEDSPVQNSAWDTQANHSTKIANLHYAVRGDTGCGASEKQLIEHYWSSLYWQNWLELLPSGLSAEVNRHRNGGRNASKHLRSNSDFDHDTEPSKRRELEFEPDDKKSIGHLGDREWSPEALQLEMLKKLGYPTYQSRYQMQALSDMVHQHPAVLVVLPTGGGKSLLFQLPPLLDGAGITVVIVPFVSLKDDMVDKCNRLNIPCDVWGGAPSFDNGNGNGNGNGTRPKLIFASLEHVGCQSFLAWLQMMNVTKRLDRIVLDECHLLLTSDADYRLDLRRLKHLRDIPVQMVYLTGSLPVSATQRLKSELLYSGECLFRTIRAPTARPNLKLQICRQEASKHDTIANLQIADWREKRSNINKRAIIFVKSKENGSKLATEIGCLFYHATLPDKDEIFHRWRAGTDPKDRIVVATSALYQGIDLPNINFVLMITPPDSMYHFVQAMGRGGRDGSVARILVLLHQNWKARVGPDLDAIQARYESFLGASTPQCRYRILNECLDGISQACGSTTATVNCDNCIISNTPGAVDDYDWFDPTLIICNYKNMILERANRKPRATTRDKCDPMRKIAARSSLTFDAANNNPGANPIVEGINTSSTNTNNTGRPPTLVCKTGGDVLRRSLKAGPNALAACNAADVGRIDRFKARLDEMTGHTGKFCGYCWLNERTYV